MTEQIEIPIELTDGGDCQLHYHQLDRTPRQDTVHGLQMVTRVREVSTDQTLTSNDDIMLCSATCTLTLPPAYGGREFEVIKNFSGGQVTVSLTSPDTIFGNSSILLYNKGTALHFKAISNGYVII